VQRPDIRKVIETDTSLLEFLARLLERYVPEAQIIGPVGLVEEFTRTIMLELDFNVEANNVQKCAKNLAVFEDIVLPKVYKKFTSSKVLTLERLQGERYTDFAALDRLGTNRSAIVVLGARALFKSVLVDGLFHADLHGGNLFVLPGNKLGIIDFGMVGRLSQKSRGIFANMLVSILTEDYENLCYQYAELGDGSGSINFQKFQRDVQNLIAPYMGLSAREVNTARVLLESTRVAARYQIRIPGDWMLLIKSLVTIEGMGRVLDPDFDLLQLSDEFVGTLVKNQFSAERIGKDFLWAGKDLLALSRDLPRQIRWMFRKFNSDDFAFEIKIPQLDKIRKQLEVTEKRSSLTLLASALLVGSSIAMSRSSTEALAFGLPGLSLFFIGAAALILFRLFWFK
jgi:ubiquinone biosynthesis protein